VAGQYVLNQLGLIMLLWLHEVGKFDVQLAAARAAEATQQEPADCPGAVDYMSLFCIIPGEQQATLRTNRRLHISDSINAPGFVILHCLTGGGNHGQAPSLLDERQD